MIGIPYYDVRLDCFEQERLHRERRLEHDGVKSVRSNRLFGRFASFKFERVFSSFDEANKKRSTKNDPTINKIFDALAFFGLLCLADGHQQQ